MTDNSLDQGFRRYKSKLITTSAPYDPIARTGRSTDTARYIARPGIDFLRPWIAIRNGPAFQWPLLEGFTLSIDPTLGIHKFIDDNKVAVDVVHSGEEHFTLTGMFPGASASNLVFALRDIVYQTASAEGKILFVPELFSHAQRVQVVRFESSRAEDDRGRDLHYTLEVVRIGFLGGKLPNARKAPRTTPLAPKKTARVVKVDAKHNTLRKIAAWKLGGADKWRTLYTINRKWFDSHNIHLAKAPDFRLPLGTALHY